jgi:periplasmic protein TonB
MLVSGFGAGGGDRLGPRQGSDLPLSQRVYRVGGGVSAPVLIHQVEPEYTEEARKANYRGTVRLSIEIDATGTPTNIRVQRGLGLGLNESAGEAVKRD